MAGDQIMKITKNDLKRIILETLNEVKAASAELTTTEQGIVDQVDKFLLNLANQQGVDLNTNRALIQRIMKLLQDKLSPADTAPQGEEG
jgi:uncharacterized protein Smg (DUF494 family)